MLPFLEGIQCEATHFTKNPRPIERILLGKGETGMTVCLDNEWMVANVKRLGVLKRKMAKIEEAKKEILREYNDLCSQVGTLEGVKVEGGVAYRESGKYIYAVDWKITRSARYYEHVNRPGVWYVVIDGGVWLYEAPQNSEEAARQLALDWVTKAERPS